jgi:hypothetical protein
MAGLGGNATIQFVELTMLEDGHRCQATAGLAEPPPGGCLSVAGESLGAGRDGGDGLRHIINTGGVMAVGCTIAPMTSIPGSLVFQTTNPATNAVVGTVNAPVDILSGGVQSFVIAVTPTAPVASTDLALSFDCTNTESAPVHSGLNTLLLSASATPIPDIVALGATISNDGILTIPGPTGTGAFAVATVNVGVGGTIHATTDTGGVSLPLGLTICETNPATGVCLAPPAAAVTTTINASATPTFAIIAAPGGSVGFDPAVNRIFVRFRDAGNVVRGATSVAVRTQ